MPVLVGSFDCLKILQLLRNNGHFFNSFTRWLITIATEKSYICYTWTFLWPTISRDIHHLSVVCFSSLLLYNSIVYRTCCNWSSHASIVILIYLLHTLIIHAFINVLVFTFLSFQFHHSYSTFLCNLDVLFSG